MAKATLAKRIAKQLARLTDTMGDPKVRNRRDPQLDTSSMNVEGRAGMPEHLEITDPNMHYKDQQRFNDAAQTLLQNDDGSPIFESMGLLFDQDNRAPKTQGEGPGMWLDPITNKPVRNPTTEYRFDKTEDWRQNLAADYAGAVMGQDGVAISDLQPGLPRGDGYVSIMRPAGSGIEKSLEDLGKLPSVGGANPTPTAALDSWKAFGAPGSQGDIIGSIDPISPAEAMHWKKAIGNGAEMYHRPGGADAYRAAVGGEYRSVADNMGRLKDSFLERGMGDAFDDMLRQTAKQSTDAYRTMGNISGSAPEANFGILWEHINNRPKEKPQNILKQLIDDQIISMDEMNAIMQQFQPQQPEGLLA